MFFEIALVVVVVNFIKHHFTISFSVFIYIYINICREGER